MSIFKFQKDNNARELEISMAGVKIGSKVLQIDGADGGLIAELAKVTGLSGHACALVREANQAEKFTRAAAAAGVFVKVTVAPISSMPYEPNFFDLVVIKIILSSFLFFLKSAKFLNNFKLHLFL